MDERVEYSLIKHNPPQNPNNTIQPRVKLIESNTLLLGCLPIPAGIWPKPAPRMSKSISPGRKELSTEHLLLNRNRLSLKSVVAPTK
eukprot:scaffold14602_cov52-Cyclotella_meneghiniana.AAC.3